MREISLQQRDTREGILQQRDTRDGSRQKLSAILIMLDSRAIVKHTGLGFRV
jgi:hypothetical protein